MSTIGFVKAEVLDLDVGNLGYLYSEAIWST